MEGSGSVGPGCAAFEMKEEHPGATPLHQQAKTYGFRRLSGTRERSI